MRPRLSPEEVELALAEGLAARAEVEADTPAVIPPRGWIR